MWKIRRVAAVGFDSKIPLDFKFIILYAFTNSPFYFFLQEGCVIKFGIQQEVTAGD